MEEIIFRIVEKYVDMKGDGYSIEGRCVESGDEFNIATSIKLSTEANIYKLASDINEELRNEGYYVNVTFIPLCK